MQYSILDPTGNITALVESSVKVERQVEVARRIMKTQPEVEQVGFVQRPAETVSVPAEMTLRMAGGEFCGNATMSAAALYAYRGDVPSESTLCLRVSGALDPVKVKLCRTDEGVYKAAVCMPPSQSIEERLFTVADERFAMGLVRMRGISHLIVDSNSALFELQHHTDLAERYVREWCAELGCDGLGIMFVDLDAKSPELTPLVYVPKGDTVFWESSCASGTAAVGMWLAYGRGSTCDITFVEPGGELRVVSDPASGDTWLHGTVRLVGSYQS